MISSGRERRTRERHCCSLYLQFVNHRTGELIGTLADISPGGFRLESTRPISSQANLTLRLDVPSDIFDRQFITLVARSRWSKPDPIDPRLYNTGFEIIGMDAIDLRAVERIIQRYGSSPIGIDIGMSYAWGR
jgi:hypothetical protein